jgi:hypothetical protein
MRKLTWATAVGCCVVSSATAAAAPYVPTRGTAATKDVLVTIHPDGPAAKRGIGVVHLNETVSEVTRSLGPGHKIESGDYRYRSGAITIEVIYGPEHEALRGPPVEVNSISTSSTSGVLYGHRLDQGLKALLPILKAHRWHVFRCHGEVFTSLLPGGPGTGIAWKKGRLHEVVIDAGGSWGQQCEAVPGKTAAG